jgi:hypothetical protein
MTRTYERLFIFKTLLLCGRTRKIIKKIRFRFQNNSKCNITYNFYTKLNIFIKNLGKNAALKLLVRLQNIKIFSNQPVFFVNNWKPRKTNNL